MGKKKTVATEATEVPSIEAAMEELQEIVTCLEDGQEPLDASLQKFERGMMLLRNCHRQLETAASRIEILTGMDAEGRITVSPVDGTATSAQRSTSVTREPTNSAEPAGDDGATLF